MAIHSVLELYIKYNITNAINGSLILIRHVTLNEQNNIFQYDKQIISYHTCVYYTHTHAYAKNSETDKQKDFLIVIKNKHLSQGVMKMSIYIKKIHKTQKYENNAFSLSLKINRKINKYEKPK